MPPPHCRRYDVIVFGPTSESSPNEERRLELANIAINNDDSATVRSVATYKSLEEVMTANSPLEHCPVSDDSQYFVFFRLEFESDVSMGEHDGDLVWRGRGMVGREEGGEGSD